MTPAVTQWLEALRSGKYEQGKEFLHRIKADGTSQYCCLGVACAISDLATPKERTKDCRGNKIMEYDVSVSDLPRILVKNLKLRTELGHFTQDERTLAITQVDRINTLSSLARLNDYGATFEQIAKIIELQPEGLFIE